MCEKAFAMRGTLKQHKEIHKDEKYYKWNTCEKVFISWA